MATAFIPGLKADYSTKVLKVRELPLLGRSLVKVGDIVTGSDPVLAADLPGNLNILRISEKLGIDPDEVIKGINRIGLKVGSRIKKKGVVAEHSGLFGLFKSRYESPCNGIIEYISNTNGHVGVREKSTPLTVTAYVPGTIVKVDEGKSVVIESHGAYIQGIFGVGGEKIGKIIILNVDSGNILKISDLPEDCSGSILAGGTRPSIEVIREASNRGAVGLIVGAIDDEALTQYLGYDLGVAITGDEELSMTLIITEGFGDLAISDRIIDLLKKFNGAVASINGATQVRAGAVRPEIVIAHNNFDDSHASSKNKDRALEIGSRVRVIRVPYFGLYGEVIELPHQLCRIESGAETRVLVTKLSDGRTVTVPRANVEIVS